MTLPTYLESAMQPLLRGIVEVMCSWREWFNDSQVKRAQKSVEEVERSLRERIFQMNFVEQLYYARTIHSFSEDLVSCQGSLELVQSSLVVPGLAALLLNVGRSPDVGLCERNGAFFVVVPALNAMVCEGGVILPHNPTVMAEVFQEIDSSFSHLDSLNQRFLKLFRQTALLKGKSHTDAYPCYFQLNCDKSRERSVFLTEEERVLDHERAFVRTITAGRISDSSLGDIEGHREVKSLAETNRTFTHSSTVTERSCLCLMEGVPSVELAEGVEALLTEDLFLFSQKIKKPEGRDGSKSFALSEVDLTSDVYAEDELRSFDCQVSRATTIEKELPAVLKERATEIVKAPEKIKKWEMAFDRTHSQATAESQTLDRFSEDQSEDLVVNSSDQQTAADAHSELLRVMSGVVNVAAASERQPVANASFERQPVADAPFERQPVADASFERQPVADASFERQPVADASFERQPVYPPPPRPQPPPPTSWCWKRRLESLTNVHAYMSSAGRAALEELDTECQETICHAIAWVFRADSAVSLIGTLFNNNVFSRKLLGVQDKHGNTPLHNAVMSGDAMIVREFVRLNLPAIFIMNYEHATPLDIAVSHRNNEVVECLLKMCVASDPHSTRSIQLLQTSLLKAMKVGYTHYLEILLELHSQHSLAIDFECTDCNGYTAWHYLKQREPPVRAAAVQVLHASDLSRSLCHRLLKLCIKLQEECSFEETETKCQTHFYALSERRELSQKSGADCERETETSDGKCLQLSSEPSLENSSMESENVKFGTELAEKPALVVPERCVNTGTEEPSQVVSLSVQLSPTCSPEESVIQDSVQKVKEVGRPPQVSPALKSLVGGCTQTYSASTPTCSSTLDTLSERVMRQRKMAEQRNSLTRNSTSSESDSSKLLKRRSLRPQGTAGKYDESASFPESVSSSEEPSLTDSALSDSATIVEKRQLLSLQKLAKLKMRHKSNGKRQPIWVSSTQTITVNTFFCADGTLNKTILKRISSVIYKVGYHHLRYEIHQQLFPVFGFSPLKRALTGRERKIAREIVDVVCFKRCPIPSNIVENLEVLEKVLKDRERQDQACADHERGKKRPAKSAASLAPAKSQTAKPPKRSTGREPLEDTEPDGPLTPSPTDTTSSISCGSAKPSASITTTTQSPAIPILNLLTHSEEKKQGVNDSEVYGSTTHTPVHIAADSPLLDDSTELCTNNSTNIAVDVPLLDGYTKQCATNTTNTAADSGLWGGSTKQCATNTAADNSLLNASTKLSATNTTNSELVSYNPSATTTASTHSPPSCREEESSGLSVLEFTNSSNPLNVIHTHMKRFSQCCPRHDIKNIVTIGTTYPPSDAFGPKRRYSSIKDIQSDPSHSEFDFTKKLSAQSSSNRHYRDSESNQIMFERPSPESVLRQNRGVLPPKPSLAHSLMETTESHPSLPLSSRQHTSQLHPPTQSLVPQPSKNSEAAVATTTNRETSIENHQGNTESTRRLENARSSIPSRSSTSFAESQTAPEDHKERLRSAAELLHAQDYTRILPLAYEGKPPSIPPVHQIPYVFITALAYYKLSSHKKSVHFFTECLRLAGECGRDGDITICNIYIGDIEFAKRRYSEAAGRYQTALHHYSRESVAQEFRMVMPTRSAVWLKCGSAFKNASRVGDSVAAYEKAIELAASKKDQLSAHTSLGNLFQGIGENGRAVKEYEAAIKLAQELQDHVSLGWNHGNLGNALLGLHQRDKALHHLFKALDMAVDFETTPQAIGRAYNNLGTAFQSLNELAKAEEHYDLALAQAIYGNDVPGQARVYGNIGNLQMLNKQYDRVNDNYACTCYKWSKSHVGVIVFLRGPDFERCDEIYRPHVVYPAIQKYYLQGTRDLEYVIKHHEDNFSGIKGSSKGLSLSVSLFETNSRTFHRMQDCLVHIQKGDDQPIRFEDALLVAEQSSARTLGELMLKRRGPQLEHELMSPPSLFQMKSIVGRQSCPVVYLSYTGERLLGWLLYPTTLFDGQTSSSINMFEVPLSDNDFDGKSFDYHLRYSLNEQLVEKSFEMYKPFDHEKDKTEPLEKLYDLVARPVMMMLSKMDDTHPQQRSAEKMVTQHKRGEKKEGVRKIVVIPDSYTNLLPFTCVLNKDTGRFWGDKFYFQIMPSLLTMGILDQLPTVSVTIPVPYQQMLCVVGNPNIPRFTFNNEDWDLGKLPHATKEAEWVSHILQCNPILHEQATKEAVLMRIMNAKVIHLATHGSAVAGFLTFAGMTSSSSEAVKAERVLIYPEEIESLNISPALVVLSSCDSGRGVFKADGIQGMARAFILAGAQAVLTALWRVPDESACIFMQFFYQYLVEGVRGTEALHKAILCLRCFSKYSQYIHWSGYQLTGREFQFSVSQSSSRAHLATRPGTSSVFPRLDVLIKCCTQDKPKIYKLVDTPAEESDEKKREIMKLHFTTLGSKKSPQETEVKCVESASFSNCETYPLIGEAKTQTPDMKESLRTDTKEHVDTVHRIESETTEADILTKKLKVELIAIINNLRAQINKIERESHMQKQLKLEGRCGVNSNSRRASLSSCCSEMTETSSVYSSEYTLEEDSTRYQGSNNLSGNHLKINCRTEKRIGKRRQSASSKLDVGFKKCLYQPSEAVETDIESSDQETLPLSSKDYKSPWSDSMQSDTVSDYPPPEFKSSDNTTDSESNQRRKKKAANPRIDQRKLAENRCRRYQSVTSDSEPQPKRRKQEGEESSSMVSSSAECSQLEQSLDEMNSTKQWSGVDNFSSDVSSEPCTMDAPHTESFRVDSKGANVMALQSLPLQNTHFLEYYHSISEPSVYACVYYYHGKYHLRIDSHVEPRVKKESDTCSESFTILQQELFKLRTSKLKKVVVVIDANSDCITQPFIIDPRLTENYYFQVIPCPPEVITPEVPRIVLLSRCFGQNACIVGNPTIPSHLINSNRHTFPCLPAATEEALFLSKLFKSEPIIENSATKEAVIERLRGARFVHIATHCVEGEGLVFSDQILTVEDVEELDFQNEPPALVVLNCCETAEAMCRPNGMKGLALAFLQAGVSAVVSIHGKINDDLACQFSRCFYQNLIEKEIVGTLSLHKAMLTTYNSENSSHRYLYYGKDVQFF